MAGETNGLPWWEAAAAAEAEASKATGRPQSSKADPDAAAADAELDAEMAAKAAALRKAGMSADEVERHTGKSSPAVSKASLESELAELKALKSTNAKAYWSNEVQARELELIEQLQSAKSGKAAPARTLQNSAGSATDAKADDAKPTAAETRLAAIDEELAALQEKRRDTKGKERDKLDARELELIAERQVVEVGSLLGEDVAPEMVEYLGAHGGVKAGVGVLAGLVRGSGTDITTWQEFDALPPAVRTAAMKASLGHNGSLSGIDKSIETSLSGSDLAAYRGWRDRHGDAIRAGLVK
jgi:hypothetical protein